MRDMVALVNFTCAVIGGKWALDMECDVFKHLLMVLGGIFLGPLMLLGIYIYMMVKGRN